MLVFVELEASSANRSLCAQLDVFRPCFPALRRKSYRPGEVMFQSLAYSMVDLPGSLRSSNQRPCRVHCKSSPSACADVIPSEIRRRRRGRASGRELGSRRRSCSSRKMLTQDRPGRGPLWCKTRRNNPQRGFGDLKTRRHEESTSAASPLDISRPAQVSNFSASVGVLLPGSSAAFECSPLRQPRCLPS